MAEIARHDLVINASGPYAQTLIPPIRAAIAAEKNYCDLLEGANDAERALALSPEAKAAGITALIGIGQFPGVTNLLAKHAASALHQPENIKIGIVLSVKTSGDPRQRLSMMRESRRIGAGMQAIFESSSRPTRSYHEGQWAESAQAVRETELELPQFGRIKMSPISLSEPITLPRHIAGLQNVSTFFGMFPDHADILFRQQTDRVAAGEIDEAQAVLSLFEALAEAPEGAFEDPRGEPQVTIWAEATGRKDGRAARCQVWAKGAWGSTSGVLGGTSSALVVAAFRILRGEISERGIIPPEAVIDPIPFFAELAGQNPARARADDLLSVSFAWCD